MKAAFFDRDGVINNDRGHYYIYKPEDFTLNKGVTDLLQWLMQQNYILILVSNQGGISKGIYSCADTDEVHRKMNENLESKGVHFTEIYYCPHHPDVENCICRKPGTLLIEKAVSRFQINTEHSLFIGDRETDMLTGRSAGLITILAEPNQDMSLLIAKIRDIEKTIS